MPTTVHVVHAFTREGEGGNPAGVVGASGGLSLEEQQEMAARMGLSETVFLHPSHAATRKLLFFTPNKQVDDCGHATVAAFAWMREEGLVSPGPAAKEITTGVRAIDVEERAVFMQQPWPEWNALPQQEFISNRVATSLGVSSVGSLALSSTALPFLMVEMGSPAELGRLQPDAPSIEALSRELTCCGYYAYSIDRGRPAVETRMFAPLYGIDEEPATGMAAGALAGYLAATERVEGDALTVLQGHLMPEPSPSRIMVRLDRRNQTVWVGGEAAMGRRVSI